MPRRELFAPREGRRNVRFWIVSGVQNVSPNHEWASPEQCQRRVSARDSRDMALLIGVVPPAAVSSAP